MGIEVERVKDSIQQSRKGRYFSGPWSKQQYIWKWMGPYSTKAGAESDARGLLRFLSKEESNVV